MPKIDKEAYQKRLARLSEIFSGMVSHAAELSRYRCPYRDKSDHCTAKFRCRNQDHPESDEQPIMCKHDGRFNHHSAWENSPLTKQRAKRKISEIKRAAADRRRTRE